MSAQPGTACAICEQPIEPEPRYFTAAGEPRHMLCDETTGEPTVPAQVARNLRVALSLAYNYVALIARGEAPAVNDHASRVAADRLERIEAAMVEADDHL